jgi:tellurite resistance-related uncharacterized protein
MRDDKLPNNVTEYKRTAEFDETSMPDGLRRAHSTKPGVWALIHVVQGKLLYRRTAAREEQILTPEQPGLVRPEEEHMVVPQGPVRFYVAFHAAQSPPHNPHQGRTNIVGDD